MSVNMSFSGKMWLFLLPPIIFSSTVETAIIQKYTLESVSDSEWVTKAEYSGVSNMAVCTMIGHSQEEYYSYSYDVATRVCQLGSADLSNLNGSGNKMVTYRNIPYFGMVQGHKNGGDPSINIILPNGKVCPPSDHGIPDFDLAAPTNMHGLVEHQGVIYKVAGKNTAGKQTTSYKLDLNSDNPGWQSIAPILTTGRVVPKSGLVGHGKHLFLTFCGLCPDNAADSMQMYDIVKDTWTGLDSSLANIAPACPGVATKDNFLYIIMGKVCDLNTVTDMIQVLDMSDPTSPTGRVLTHKTAKAVSAPACTFTQLDGSDGILCAGGQGSVSKTKQVQFMPIQNGYSTGDGFFLSETLGLVGDKAFLINFGNGQLAFYGGLKSGEYRNTVNLWDPVTKAFIHDEALVSGLDSSDHAGGLISTEYVKKNCWKHL